MYCSGSFVPSVLRMTDCKSIALDPSGCRPQDDVLQRKSPALGGTLVITFELCRTNYSKFTIAVNSASDKAFVSKPSITLNWLNIIWPLPNGTSCKSTPVLISPSLSVTERA